MRTVISKIKFDYSNIAAKIYSRSFIAVCIFILISLGMVWHRDDDMVETLKIVLNFIEHVLWIYAVPVSLQIAGEKVQKAILFFTKK